MDGAALATYLARRLAEEGLTLEVNRQNELYDYLTEGRDEVVAAFALAAPIVVKQIITLEVDLVDTNLFAFPAAAPDPFRVLMVREKESREPLDPSSAIDQDNGDYEWQSLRQLRLADDTDTGTGIEVVYVPHAGAIVAETAEAGIGLPTTCHRAIGKYAAVLALTADEESDATNAMGLFSRELDRLERIYGDYDANGGFSLRAAFMESAGKQFGENLY